MKIKAALFAAAATVAIAPAANAYEGLYGAIGAGLTYMAPDLDFKSTAPAFSSGFHSDLDYKNGIGVYTALGYAYGNAWRGELEFSYRANDVRQLAGDGLGFNGWPEGTLEGEVKSYSFMANLIRDFDFGSNVVKPYLGAGIGFSRVKAEMSGLNPVAIPGLTTMAIDDGDIAFAYQGIAGLAFSLAENLVLDVSYRYFATHNTDFVGTVGAASSTFSTDYRSHNVFAGLRWNFGSAPAPVRVQYKDCWDGSSVPVSAECPPQLVERQAAVADPINVVVYFDYDKSNLTPEAASLIREAATRARAGNINTVRVEGNTDTSGSATYNMALSQRRANVVRDALIANGVPANMIETVAFGQTNLAKPTADGVREPLNRRTEVRITFQ